MTDITTVGAALRAAFTREELVKALETDDGADAAPVDMNALIRQRYQDQNQITVGSVQVDDEGSMTFEGPKPKEGSNG